MNEDLLKTPVVKGQLIKWIIDDKLSISEIAGKLWDIHLIDITIEELQEYTKTLLLSNGYEV